MQTKAKNYYKQGYSCSESIIKAAMDKGLVSEALLPVASSFSGGMSSGCICGAVAASQMVIGALYGKNDIDRNGKKSRKLAKTFVDEFKAKNRATCCRVLTARLDYNSPERKENCARLVDDCANILDNVLELETNKV